MGVVYWYIFWKAVMRMVLRFRDTRRLLYAVSDSYDRVFPEGEERAELMQNIRLLPNGDLYINGNYDPEIAGMFLQAMRAHGFLQEEAEAIRMNLS